MGKKVMTEKGEGKVIRQNIMDRITVVMLPGRRGSGDRTRTAPNRLSNDNPTTSRNRTKNSKTRGCRA